MVKQQEYQELIVRAGALPCLVESLKIHKICTISQPLINLLKRTADAITSLAHENNDVKTCIRFFSFLVLSVIYILQLYSLYLYTYGIFRREGGIPPLVELLEFNDNKVQRATARALGTLAFKNDGNKNQVVNFPH